MISTIKKLIPKTAFSAYHYLLALLGAIIYRFPSKKIKIIAVTGTKGKTSTVEFVNAILEESGKHTALAGTLRFKIDGKTNANLYKMTMPGRFFIQKFLRDAVNAKCEYVVLEISSEAAIQYRNKFIDLDALIFTNIAPEHIERHGSYENYLNAKLSIAHELEKSGKKIKTIIVNVDDREAEKFLAMNIENKITYSMSEAQNVFLTPDLIKFTYKGTEMTSELPGKFNIYNMLGAIKYGEFEKIDLTIIQNAILHLKEIKGRAQSVTVGPQQKFKVIVDYAHTPDSLIAIYEAFPGRKIGVFGSCGGGRDIWKRKEMAMIADTYCEEIILTDEDPYDDDPRAIVDDLAKYITKKTPEIIMDRREAIAKAIRLAKEGDTILITGKGTDPYIMRQNGMKENWSDAEIAKEELEKNFKRIA